MSQVYTSQPATSGKVILETTEGEIEIELWTQEAPKACKNFITLCMEGYYDNTIFHRIIKGFMMQGGDPTGTGQGGESCYGQKFQDEFHQRLKFSQRGIVAMANTGIPNDNGSQFFITFDQCEWLNDKHTIFGKVVGNTMYNVLQLQDIEIGENDRPVNPPRIVKTKVTINPFDDIILRDMQQVKQQQDQESDSDEDIEAKKQRQQQIQKAQKKALFKKPKKNQNLLSFDDEENNGENNDEDGFGIDPEGKFQEPKSKNVLNIKSGMSSSHDIAGNSKLSTDTAIDMNELEEKRRKQKSEDGKLKNLKDNIKNAKQLNNDEEKMLMKKKLKEGNTGKAIDSIINNPENAELMGYKTRQNKKTGKMEIYFSKNSDEESGSQSGSDSDSDTDSDEYINEKEKQIRQKQKQEYENLKLDVLTFKKGGIGSNNTKYNNMVKAEKKLLSTLEQRKLKYMQQDKINQKDILGKLQQFRSQINSKEVKEKNSWVNHKLKFHVDSERAYNVQEVKQNGVQDKVIDKDYK